MINFAAICPHPPIIIPAIGKSEVNRTGKTIAAMLKLAGLFAKAKPDIVVIVSPHSPVSVEEISIGGEDNFNGNFKNFNEFEINLNFKNNLDLVHKVQNKAEDQGIHICLAEFNPLDHGITVPLYYLSSLYSNFSLIPIAYSYQDVQQLKNFGKIIADIADRSEQRVAFIASGDLSHCLTKEAPLGYSKAGKKFDEQIIKIIKENKLDKLISMNVGLVESAGQCGWRSFLILSGLLEDKDYTAELLAYEHPFGVGYLVANFEL